MARGSGNGTKSNAGRGTREARSAADEFDRLADDGPVYPSRTATESQANGQSVREKESLESDTVGVKDAASSGKRRTPGQPVQTEPAGAAVKMDKAGISILLTIVETIMVGRFGDGAKFTKEERGFIEEPAAKMLSAMSPSTVKKMAGFANPAMVGVGVFMYSMRISSLSAVKEVTGQNPTPIRPRVPTQRPAGVQVTEDSGHVDNTLADAWR